MKNGVIELDKEKNRIILSHKAVQEEEKLKQKQQLLSSLQAGQVLEGTVQRITDFGAFVDIGGMDGLVHISQLSHQHVEKTSDVVEEGQKVQVKVLSVDGENERISLSIKETLPGPWANIAEKTPKGSILDGTVKRIVSYGAFVEVLPGVEGLVHISQISHKHIGTPNEVLSEGDHIKVKVLDVNETEQRLSLSIKDALGDPWTGASAKYEIGSIIEGHLEKREKFGLFITLEPGVVGLMPSSNISSAAKPSDFEKLKSGGSVQVMIQEVDEEKRRITLTSPDQKEGDNWKQFADTKKLKSVGTMESLFLEAMKKKK